MRVRVIIGAHAYANIEDGARDMDVLLSPGKGVAKSLRESASEMREKAAKYLERAGVMERAANHYEAERNKERNAK